MSTTTPPTETTMVSEEEVKRAKKNRNIWIAILLFLLFFGGLFGAISVAGLGYWVYSANSELSAAEATKAEVETKLSAAEATKAEVETKLTSAETKVSELEGDIANLNEEVKEVIASTKAEFEGVIAGLRAEISDVEVAKAETETEISVPAAVVEAPPVLESVSLPSGNAGVVAGVDTQGEHVPGLKRLANPTNLQHDVTRYHTLDRSAYPYALFLARNGGALCQHNGTPEQLGIPALLQPGEELRVHPEHKYYYVLLPQGAEQGMVQTTSEQVQAVVQGAASEMTPTEQTHPVLGRITVFKNREGKNADANLIEAVRSIAGGYEVQVIPAGQLGAGACYIKK